MRIRIYTVDQAGATTCAMAQCGLSLVFSTVFNLGSKVELMSRILRMNELMFQAGDVF